MQTYYSDPVYLYFIFIHDVSRKAISVKREYRDVDSESWRKKGNLMKGISATVKASEKVIGWVRMRHYCSIGLSVTRATLHCLRIQPATKKLPRRYTSLS